MLSSWSRDKLAGILAGAVAVAAITWLRLTLAPSLAGSDMALIFYIAAVILASRVGGAIAGLTTTVLALAAGIALIIGPQSFMTSRIEWVRVAVFTAESVAIFVMIELLQRRTRALNETAGELAAERVLVDRMALEDFMTGLGNRRAFEIDLARLLARSSREATPLTVAIADVDGLKHTNDEKGHTTGDALLVAVAQTLSGSCRASDAAYRIGGDEFALILSGAGRDDYEALHERLRGLLNEVGVRFVGVGVSIGAAHSPEDGRDASTLVRIADSRMYTAKTADYPTG